MVWIKDWKKEPLQPSWTGPHLILLATPITVKVSGITPWTHHSQIKKASASKDLNNWQANYHPEIEVSEDVTTAHHHPRELQPRSSHLLEAHWSMCDGSLRIQPPGHKCIPFLPPLPCPDD
jgi:hypothetical protein